MILGNYLKQNVLNLYLHSQPQISPTVRLYVHQCMCNEYIRDYQFSIAFRSTTDTVSRNPSWIQLGNPRIIEVQAEEFGTTT
jgi:hypothetical protein